MSLQDNLNGTVKREPMIDFTVRGVRVHAAESEKESVEKLFDSLASIPTGQNAINDMIKYRTRFSYESSMGSTGGYFDPMTNRIVLSKSAGMDFMESALVHEARHLYQFNNGRRMLESKHLDAASKLMINRATEADAQTQAMKACAEWQAIGHDGPMKKFAERYSPITDAYAKNHSLSDAFKGWYDDERITAAYEQGYEIERRVSYMTPNMLRYTDINCYVSASPAEVGRFCGADRVDGFCDFLNSPKARQVHLLTKTAMEMTEAGQQAVGAMPDTSIEALPVRELKDNSAAQMYAEKNIQKTREKYKLDEAAKKKPGVDVYTAFAMAVDAVEKINKAAINGTVDEKAKADLQAAKTAYIATVDPTRARAMNSRTFAKMRDGGR